jgi:hypothetical protein
MKRTLVVVPTTVFLLLAVAALVSVPGAFAAYSYYYTVTPVSFWNINGVPTMPDSTWSQIAPQYGMTVLNTVNSGPGEMKLTLTYSGNPSTSPNYVALLGASYTGQAGFTNSSITQAYQVIVNVNSVRFLASTKRMARRLSGRRRSRSRPGWSCVSF